MDPESLKPELTLHCGAVCRFVSEQLISVINFDDKKKHCCRASLSMDPHVSYAACQALAEVSLFQRDRVAGQLLQPGYVAKLLNLFRVRRCATLRCTDSVS